MNLRERAANLADEVGHASHQRHEAQNPRAFDAKVAEERDTILRAFREVAREASIKTFSILADMEEEAEPPQVRR